MIKPTIQIEYYAEGKKPSFTTMDWMNIVIRSDCLLPIELMDAIMHNVRSTSEDPLHCVALRAPDGFGQKRMRSWHLYSYGGKDPDKNNIDAIGLYLEKACEEQPHRYAWMQRHHELLELLLGMGLESGSDEFLELYHKHWFSNGPMVEEMELPDLGELP